MSEQANTPIMMGMPGELIFSKNGRWLHDGKQVTHKQIELYFSQHLRFDNTQNKYIIEVDGKAVEVKVEDTAYVVRTIDTSESNWKLILNDESLETIQANTLKVSSDNIFYLDVKNGEYQARLMRPAMQAILSHIDEKDGKYSLEYQNKLYEILNRQCPSHSK